MDHSSKLGFRKKHPRTACRTAVGEWKVSHQMALPTAGAGVGVDEGARGQDGDT